MSLLSWVFGEKLTWGIRNNTIHETKISEDLGGIYVAENTQGFREPVFLIPENRFSECEIKYKNNKIKNRNIEIKEDANIKGGTYTQVETDDIESIEINGHTYTDFSYKDGQLYAMCEGKPVNMNFMTKENNFSQEGKESAQESASAVEPPINNTSSQIPSPFQNLIDFAKMIVTFVSGLFKSNSEEQSPPASLVSPPVTPDQLPKEGNDNSNNIKTQQEQRSL